jgi:hypothetical protein
MNQRSGLQAALMVCLLSGCASEERISYRKEVYPILEANCFACHLPPSGDGYIKSGLNLETYETLMKGTLYGPVILPGDSRHSILNMLVEGRADASVRMPHHRKHPLADRKIGMLRRWVDQGATDN